MSSKHWPTDEDRKRQAEEIWRIFVQAVEDEARAEGPDAVAELEAFRAHFAQERAADFECEDS